MSERGMKKWAPYKSLNEQEDYLKKLHNKQEKMERPSISSDEADNINEILVNYHGEELLIEYWRNDKINTVSSTLSKIDPANKKIVLPLRKTIYFAELIRIERV
jgi:hypothetical protein